MNDYDQALVDLHHLLNDAQSHWLDWSRGSQAKLPDEPVQICSTCATVEPDCVFVNGEVLLDLFGQGLIKLGDPTLYGLILTDDGQRLVERLITDD